jgi:anti-sigma factor RsiW
MNHRSIEKLLSSFVDSELDNEGMKSVRVHLEGCASCRKRVEEMQLIRSGIRTTATVDLPDNFVFRVQAAMRREEEESVVWLGTERFARNVVAALCVLVSAFVAYTSLPATPPPAGVDRYFNGEPSDSAAHAVLGSQQELSKEDVMMAALTK